MIAGRPTSPAVRQRGFTLIEAMCALLLVGIVLPVAMRGLSVALKATSNADHTAEATELCRSKLAELGTGVDESNFSGGGQFEDQPNYTWQSTYTTRDDGTDELSCTVTWNQSDGPRTLTLTTLVYITGNTASDATTSSNTSSSSGGSSTP